MWSEPAQLTGLAWLIGLTFSIRLNEKIISVNLRGARLPHLWRVRSGVVAGLAQFRVIIWKNASPMKWHPGRSGSRDLGTVGWLTYTI